MRTFQGESARIRAQNAWRDWDAEEFKREFQPWAAQPESRQTMNLKNLDWMHVVSLVIALAVGIYNILIANGVTLPAQVGTVILMLVAIGNMLKQSPIATPAQIASRSTHADLRALQANREDQTR
jgi:hypothetical protein